MVWGKRVDLRGDLGEFQLSRVFSYLGESVRVIYLGKSVGEGVRYLGNRGESYI